MKPIKLITILIFSININACTKQANSSPSALLGIDANHNGVRDDLEIYIAKRFPQSEKKTTALMENARAYQKVLSVMGDPVKLSAALTDLEKAENCATFLLGKDGYPEVLALQAEMNDTYDRSVAFIKLEHIQGQRDSYLPKKNDDLKDCNFDPSKMKN